MADKTATIYFAPKGYKSDQRPFIIKGQTGKLRDYIKI